MADSSPPDTRDPVRAHQEELLDAALEMTFPASDPLPFDREPEPPELYLEDLQVGQVYRGGSIAVSEADIREFASRYDPQPFHLDPEAARASAFAGLAASGWHTAALTMRLLVDGDFRVVGGLLGLGGELRWPRATRPGDVLTVESEILSVTPSRSNPARGTVGVRNTTLNQRREAVQIAEVRLLVPRRHPAAATPVAGPE